MKSRCENCSSLNSANRSIERELLRLVFKAGTLKNQCVCFCCSMQSALKLAERFIASAIKPRPSPPPKATPAPAAE